MRNAVWYDSVLSEVVVIGTFVDTGVTYVHFTNGAVAFSDMPDPDSYNVALPNLREV